MKKFYTLLLTVLILSGSVLAQRLTDDISTGRAPYDKNVKINESLNAQLVPVQRAFGQNLTVAPTGPVSFWLTTPGTLTNLSAVTRSIFAADFNGNGVYFGLDYDTNQLVSMDTSTGVFTVVASCVPPGGALWTGMAWDNTTSTMYASYVASAGTPSYLCTIDLMTGAITTIGSDAAALYIDIAIDNTGNIYSFDIIADNLVSVNKTTGVSTIIGPVGFNGNYAQGMSFDPNTNELYLAAYNYTTAPGTGELRLANVSTGATTLVGTFQGGAEIDGFTIPGGFAPPCPVDLATNPSPADNAVDLPLTGIQLTWTNPANANSMELYFGTNPAALAMVYSGPLVTSFNVPGTLNYYTKYYWRIKEKNDTCGNYSALWSFRTIQDPNLFFALDDNFESGAGNWTITTDGGLPTCLWTIYTPEYPNLYTLPPTAGGGVFAADVDECGSGASMNSTATLTNGLDFTMYQTVMLEYDSDFNAIGSSDMGYVDVSNDGGATWTNYVTYAGVDVTAEHKVADISATAALHNNVKVRFHSVQPGWDWWWVIDNVKIISSNIIPVELVSFRAAVNGNSVSLNWMTATETNNSGFEVERSINNGAFVKIAMVTGHGTTSETQAYSFTDNKLANGTYAYRLKQVDYDGTFKYSTTVNAEVNAPKVYSLDQNYPNPFNPSTKISFTLASDSKVSLKVFNLLGQEVAVIAEGQMTAGSYNYTFDASKLNSGVYFYQIEAKGNDGSSFKSIKKMMLTK